ncbi:hypothetical protein PPYR_10351 [Photinus pyralis]|uniref:Serine protease HTRA2, mitochondrial n=1 Tax=Photinus pyralis TaxID=7054 RepID=A0A5N4AG14_PHOPY|nr:serine protease HTRA2, mitochondrial-like [Photinus pyralis]XP_031348136.1 serine protease HTRA2, mitochondrial-like [Photinus pyralis]KAB0796290.1 hypothetical protein PPYR_10351 [Photinus pyralis]
MSFLLKTVTNTLMRSNFRSVLNKNIKCTYLLFDTTFTKNENQKSTNNSLMYGVAIASTWIAYKLFKSGNIVPTVEASTDRRNQYNFIADVVETCSEAVVYIEIKDARRVDFFTGKPMTISNGSGFIIKSDGLIVTNAHVVTNKPQAKVEVRLSNGTVYHGMVEDIDLRSDLATVRIQAKNLPIMKLGDSGLLRPGEFVVAIGSPLSLSNTVTSGVISSTQRGSAELGLRDKNMVYIQTDAAITFGNSGGPLVNLNGEAIGVNSMKVTSGISFAIPINYVKDFLKTVRSNQTSQTENVKRKYMGITMLTLTDQIIYELHQRDQFIPPSITHGVLVWKVIVGSPAHSGGLQPGDIVTDINSEPIKSANDVYAILAKEKSAKLNMTVVRSGKSLNISITPEDVN